MRVGLTGVWVPLDERSMILSQGFSTIVVHQKPLLQILKPKPHSWLIKSWDLGVGIYTLKKINNTTQVMLMGSCGWKLCFIRLRFLKAWWLEAGETMPREHIAWSFLSGSKNEINFCHPKWNNAQDPLLPILGLLSPWNISEDKQVEWVGLRGILG